MDSVPKLTGIDGRLNIPPLLSRLKGLGRDAFLGTCCGHLKLKSITEICILGPYFYFCEFLFSRSVNAFWKKVEMHWLQ